jgi:hypothetical protein
MSDEPPLAPEGPEPVASTAPAAPAPLPATPVRPRWPAGDRALLTVSIVLGALLLPLLVFTVIVGITVGAQAQARLGTTIDAEDLVPGDCLQSFDTVGNAAATYDVVDCDQPHAAELVYLADLGDEFDFYIGARASSELATSICDSAMRYQLYLRDEVQDYATAKLYGVYQARTGWRPGETTFQCFLINGNGEPLVGQYFKADPFE